MGIKPDYMYLPTINFFGISFWPNWLTVVSETDLAHQLTAEDILDPDPDPHEDAKEPWQQSAASSATSLTIWNGKKLKIFSEKKVQNGWLLVSGSGWYPH